MRTSHPLLVLLIVMVALLSRNAAWGFPMLPPAQEQEEMAVAMNGQDCHGGEQNADRTSSNEDRACRIACDLGTMLPLAVARAPQTKVHASVRVPRLHTLAFADPLPPDLPPPR